MKKKFLISLFIATISFLGFSQKIITDTTTYTGGLVVGADGSVLSSVVLLEGTNETDPDSLLWYVKGNRVAGIQIRETKNTINIAPYITSIKIIDEFPNLWAITLSEPADTIYSDTARTAFTLEINGVSTTLDSIAGDTASNYFGIWSADSAAYGDSLTVQYNGDYGSGAIKDWEGLKMATVSNGVVQNLVLQKSSDPRPSIFYDYESGGTNVINPGTYDFVGNVIYDANTVKSGAVSGRVTGTAVIHSIPNTFTHEDTFSIAMSVYPTANDANNYEVWDNGNIIIELDLLGDDIDFWVNGAEAGATNFSGVAPTPINQWYHFVFVYKNGTGEIWVDGVDHTDDATIGTGGDFTGPVNIMTTTYGYIDNVFYFPDDALSATDIPILNTYPDSILYSAYVPPIDDPTPTDPYTDHANILVEFEVGPDDVGYTSEADFRGQWSGITGYKRLSNSWTSNVSSAYHPHVEAVSWDSAGTPVNTYASVWTAISGYGNKYPSVGDRCTGGTDATQEDVDNQLVYTPMNYNLGFAPQRGAFILKFDYAVKDTNIVGFRSLPSLREWKTPALNAGMAKNDYKDFPYDYGWDFAKVKAMGKGTDGSTNLLRYVTYDQGGVYPTFERQEPFLDPDTRATYYHDISDEKINVITHWYYQDENGYCFHEIFVNQEYSTGIYENDQGEPLRLTDGTIDWDCVQPSYFWGGQWCEWPPSGIAPYKFVTGATVSTIKPSSEYYQTTRHYPGDKVPVPDHFQNIIDYQQ
jgi:hypothetical protein